MWKEHWKLTREPFPAGGGAYVPLPTHEEAVARLVHAIEAGERGAVVRAGSGLGKSTVLARALDATRGPTRRLAQVASPTDGAALLAALAEGLGARVPGSAGRATAWRMLGDAVRLCRWQRLGVVLAIDDCQDLVGAPGRLDLERLDHIDPHPGARLTVVKVFRGPDDGLEVASSWELAIRLTPLTRGEAERYLTAKLAAAGRPDPTFTPRAVSRLHALATGVPRGLDRLGTLALMAGALRGLEVVPPEVVDGAARECHALSSPSG